jgi:phage tail-like protein
MTSSIINRHSTLATDPLRSFRFFAKFEVAKDGAVFDSKITTWSGGFSNISGLSINTQAIQYREGGYNTTVHQVPGMTTFTPITMQRGVLAGNDQAITWMRGLFAASSGEGIAVGAAAGATGAQSFRVNIKVFVADHPNSGPTEAQKYKMGFKIHNAWITALNYTDLNAADGAILFESMTLVHEGLSVFFTKDGTEADIADKIK